MTNIIDRRHDGGGESAPNRKKFMDRNKEQIKRAVKDSMKKINIKDIGSGDVEISIDGDMSEPTFSNEAGTGKRDIVLPGNDEYVVGDEISKPSNRSGSGSSGSNNGEGEDDFVFKVKSDEFMDLFFEDLELPNLNKRTMVRQKSTTYKKCGYSVSGAPSNINLRETFKKSFGRRLALQASIRKQMREAIDKQDWELHEELKKKFNRISFLEDIDLKFDYITAVPEVKFNAVMFCLMDVSASMTEQDKDLAKRFYILLYLFLRKVYTNIDIIFIRHTDVAKEVDENEFFYGRESGGTVMSSGVSLINKIIKERYPANIWNIYVAQASDGDNWDYDNSTLEDLLSNKIMPVVQNYFYIELIDPRMAGAYGRYGIGRYTSTIWQLMKKISKINKNLLQVSITNSAEIWPIFRDLFKNRGD